MKFQTEPFDRRRHKVAAFSSGKAELDDWLSRYAGQGERRDLTRTFVHADADGVVAGYYTLVATEIVMREATAAVSRGASSRFPIPACLLARLAVDETSQGRGLGALLLLDALTRACVAAEHVGMRAVVVDAIDGEAADFYEHFGFISLTESPQRLQITLEAIRHLLERR